MKEHLSKFKELSRGMAMRDVLTLEWVKAVQDCLRDLAAGKNIETGPGVRRHCNDGRVWLDAAPAGAPARKVAVEGNFFKTYKDPDGNLMLQGGYVWAGSGSATIDPFELMAAPVGGGDPDWAGTAGQHLVLTVTGTAEAADDVLLPQFNMSAGSLAVASDVGDPTLPTVDSLSGTFKTSLGVFGENSFSPNLPGNYGIGFCFSGFTVSRG